MNDRGDIAQGIEAAGRIVVGTPSVQGYIVYPRCPLIHVCKAFMNTFMNGFGVEQRHSSKRNFIYELSKKQRTPELFVVSVTAVCKHSAWPEGQSR